MAADTCRFWSCDAPVTLGHFTCFDHYVDYAAGDVDECPRCGRLKYNGYDECLPCSRGVPVPEPGAARLARAIWPTLDRLRPSAGPAERPAPASGIRDHRAKYRVEQSETWTAGDRGVEQFYTYILKLDDGSFYAGHTRDLRVRLTEHRDNTTASTAGGNPRLMWFAVSPTRRQAARLEARLKEMIDRNPRQIRTMILGFQDVLREVEDL